VDRLRAFLITRLFFAPPGSDDPLIVFTHCVGSNVSGTTTLSASFVPQIRAASIDAQSKELTCEDSKACIHQDRTSSVKQKPATQQPEPRETPQDDPRQQTDWPSTKQTDKPWKGNPEREQINPDRSEIDLEEWQQSNTH
jgi:hypothetical protein